MNGAGEEFDVNPDEWRQRFWGNDAGDAGTKTNGAEGSADGWGEPYMGILQLRRRQPPALLLAVFGPVWADWIKDAAKAAACPVDYVAAPLLATASTLIGHARWAQDAPGWNEPPHLWCVVVGDPSASKFFADLLPELDIVRFGRRSFVTRESLDQLIERHRVTPPQSGPGRTPR